MASTYSISFRIEKMADGENSTTWGSKTNTNWDLIEQAVSGVASVAMTDADYTLTTSNASVDEARNAVVTMTGTLTQARNVIVPSVDKQYVFKNSTTGGFSIVVKTSGGTGITIPNGETAQLYCDATNVLLAETGGADTAVLVGGGVGSLPVWTAATGSGSPVRATSPTLVTPTLVTPTLGVATATSVNGLIFSDGSGSGIDNIGVGEQSANNLTTGASNTAVGASALYDITTGSNNTAVGCRAGGSATAATSRNTFVGANAGFESVYSFTGSDNTFVGYSTGVKAIPSSSSVSQCVFIGSDAGSETYSNANVIAIGYNTSPSSDTVSNEITLGNASITSFRIPGLSLTATGTTGSGSFVLATGPTLTGLTVSGAAFTSRGITDSATATALTLSGSGANSITIANSATNPTIGTSGGSLAIGSSLTILQSNLGAFAAGEWSRDANWGTYYKAPAVGAVADVGFHSNDGFSSIRVSGTAAPGTVRFFTGTSAATENGRVFADGAWSFGLAAAPILTLSPDAVQATQRRIIITAGAAAGNPKLSTSAGSLDLGSPIVLTSQTVGTTVGAAGGASALPATPLGYLTSAINGTACKIPYYTA